jgi:hypothetical protein
MGPREGLNAPQKVENSDLCEESNHSSSVVEAYHSIYGDVHVTLIVSITQAGTINAVGNIVAPGCLPVSEI